MPDIVNAIFIRGNAVLLARRSAGRRTYPDSWSFPDGHVESGESLEGALIRELQEEVAVTPVAFRKIGAIVEPAPSTNGSVLYHFFAVTAWTGSEPAMVGDEHSAIEWFGIDAACALPDLALPEYVALLRALTHLGT